MSKMSARYIGQKVCMKTAEVYDMWNDMGLVVKDQFGDWIITELGKKIGGKMSNGNRLSVPIFELKMIEEKMIDFYNKNVK
jgi:hypothetical protein